MKTFTNKSNAARAAKKSNGGTLTGFELKGEEGAWYYAPKAGQPAQVPTSKAKKSAAPEWAVAQAAADKEAAVATAKRGGPVDPRLTAADMKNAGVKAAPAPKPAKKAVPAKKAAKKAAKKTAAVQYDPKSGPTQGRITGYHIDADRDEKHGVKRRSAGTIGGRLWAIFDKLSAKAGGPQKLEIGVVKESKDVAGFNANKVVIEFYYWRRYHGVRGRGKKQKVA